MKLCFTLLLFFYHLLSLSSSLLLFVCFILLTNFLYIIFIFILLFSLTHSQYLILSLLTFSFFYISFYLLLFLLSLSPLLFIHSYLFRFIFIPVVCNSVKPFSQISLVSLKFTDAADNPSIFPFFLITSLVFFVLPFIIRMWPKCTSKFWPGTIRHCFLFFHSRHCKYWCYSACSF